VAATIAAYVGLGAALRLVMYDPSAVIKNRHGLRAVYCVPEDLRAFPVERYVAPGDEFAYMMCSERTDLTRWCLQIDSVSGHRNYWEYILANHLKERKFERVGSRAQRPSTLYKRSDGRYCWLTLANDDPNGGLHITCAYWKDPNSRPYSKYVNLVAHAFRKLRRYMRGKTSPHNTITRAS